MSHPIHLILDLHSSYMVGLINWVSSSHHPRAVCCSSSLANIFSTEFTRGMLLKLNSEHFLDRVYENVRNGATYRGTGDNWDLVIKAGHMRKGIGNIDMHLFATNLIRQNQFLTPNDRTTPARH